jgi:hypothetical protein
MAELRIRDSEGQEHPFTRDEFVRSVGRGEIPASWEVFHGAGNRWLPVSVHPAFRQVTTGRPTAPPIERRSSELVLIYPEELKPREPARPAADPAPFEPGPVLTSAEIERVLWAPRLQPGRAMEPCEEGARSGAAATADLADSLLRTARRSMPTFTRAVSAAAGLVAQRV